MFVIRPIGTSRPHSVSTKEPSALVAVLTKVSLYFGKCLRLTLVYLFHGIASGIRCYRYRLLLRTY